MKKPFCKAILKVDSAENKDCPQTVAVCEKPVGHRGKHKSVRVARRDLFVTVEWNKDCH